MDPEAVGKIAGPRGMMMWALYHGQLEEFTVDVAAGSTGQYDTQLRLSRMTQLLTVAQQVNLAVQAPLFDLAAIARELVRLNKVRRPERYIRADVEAALRGPAGMMPVAPGVAANAGVAPGASAPPMGVGVPQPEPAVEGAPM
jgi:hypothetical protein